MYTELIIWLIIFLFYLNNGFLKICPNHDENSEE